jgi:hypothetical protein
MPKHHRLTWTDRSDRTVGDTRVLAYSQPSPGRKVKNALLRHLIARATVISDDAKRRRRV